jgi:hypothetical protein
MATKVKFVYAGTEKQATEFLNNGMSSFSFSTWLNEIRHEVLAGMQHRIDRKELPFPNLFGQRTRIIVPYVNNEHDKLSHALMDAGYDRIDWAQGMVYKKKPTVGRNGQPLVDKQGNPFPEGETATAIGKALSRLPDSKHWLDWWSKNQHMAPEWAKKSDKDQYSVIISRHPVDVLRMSDFDQITSCHTPPGKHNPQGGGYWSHCQEEAAKGGLVAFVVKAQDLAGLNKQQIEGNDEIFEDPERNTPGIKPLSRLRIRRFKDVNGEKNDLAVPELRTYGKRLPDFDEFLTKWSRDAQPEAFEDGNPDMSEYERVGGGYADNEDSALFNNFFDTDEYEDQGEDIDEQRREEIAQMHSNWEHRFKHCWVQYNEDNDVPEDDGLQFSWWGGVDVVFPAARFEGAQQDISDLDGEDEYSKGFGDEDEDDHQPALIKYLSDHNQSSLRSLSIEKADDKVNLKFAWGGEDGMMGIPDEFDTYCSELSREFDKESDYVRLANIVAKYLMEYGYMKPSENVRYQSDHPDGKFQHFKWDEGDEGPELGCYIPLAQVSDVYHKDTAIRVGGQDSGSKFATQVEGEIRTMIQQNMTNRIIGMMNQETLPGMDDIRRHVVTNNPYRNLREWLMHMKIHVGIERGIEGNDPTQVGHWFLSISAPFADQTETKDMDNALRAIHVIDEMMDKITQLVTTRITQFEKRENMWQHGWGNRISRDADYYKGVDPYRFPGERPDPRWLNNTPLQNQKKPIPELGFNQTEPTKPPKPKMAKEGFAGYLRWKLLTA